MRDSFFICFLTSETIMLSKITMYQYNVLLGGELMSESAAAALIEKMNGVMVLSIVSIGLNMLMTGLVIAELIMCIIYLARKNKRQDD